MASQADRGVAPGRGRSSREVIGEGAIGEVVARESVILVDDQDREIGTAEKLAAHRDGGRLHRAFSVFLVDGRGRLLLQRRSASKYHFPSLWTNACCSHPRPGEEVIDAARRRVREELGVDASLRPVFCFIYSAEDAASAFTEREYDHVLLGRLSVEPRPDPDEIEAIEWRDPDLLLADVESRPERYTPWFRVALPKLLQRMKPGLALSEEVDDLAG
ncbi:MAG TPA: isopentenyl-diphosphate Delta-isomerase [Myxococcota bacterium]|nr:isopentenyl-diphosphate Delta-isomerase [Myxococcota bacterium]